MHGNGVCVTYCIAELANAKSWIQAFAKGQDVHSVSTEILYPELWPKLAEPGCAYYELGEDGQPLKYKCKCKEHKKLRDETKATNFLLCYGGGPDALADEIDSTLEYAKEILSKHRAAFPDVWSYLEKSGQLAKEFKESRDQFGRRRLFPTPTLERAIEWYKEYNDDKLEYPEEIKVRNLFEFQVNNGRKSTKEEKWHLEHREPTPREAQKGMYALHGSIERRGKNHRVQGTNASMIKRAMSCGFDKNGNPYLWHSLPQYKAKLLNMVHDELVVQCPKRHGEKVAALVGDAFRRAASEVMCLVVMEHEAHIGDRWGK